MAVWTASKNIHIGRLLQQTHPTPSNVIMTISALELVITTCSWAISTKQRQSFQESASCLKEGNMDLPKMFTWKVFVIRPTHCERSMWFFTLRLYKPTGPKSYRKGAMKAGFVCFPFDSNRHAGHAKTYLLNRLIPLILMIVDRKAQTGPKCSKIGLMNTLNLNRLTCQFVPQILDDFFF